MADEEDGHFLRLRPDWLARRVEDILEPDLPIIDPHHHLWDFREWRYLFADLFADVQSGHNIRQTVFVQCFAMYRADGPRELPSLGETEFVNGVAAMSASGGYGDVRACAGIVGMVDLRLGKEAADVLSRHVAAGGLVSRFATTSRVAACAAWSQHPRTGPRGRHETRGYPCTISFRQSAASLASHAHPFQRRVQSEFVVARESHQEGESVWVQGF